MNRLGLLSLFLLIVVGCQAQNQRPQVEITDVEHLVTTTGGNLLRVNYDLTDPDNSHIEVLLQVSQDGGETWRTTAQTVTGDVGFPVAPGSAKELEWEYEQDLESSGQYQIRLVADDREEVNIQELVDQVDSARLYNTVLTLQGPRNYTADATRMESMKDHIEDELESFGLTTSRASFPVQSIPAENLIGRLQGDVTDTATIIVDAHFDAAQGVPGADDNGSGVAGMLEAARILSQYKYEKSIQFMGFDLEEAGLLGSRRYATQQMPEWMDLAGVYNFEMIGYYSEEKHSQSLPTGFDFAFPQAYQQVESDSFRGNFIALVANEASADLRDRYASAAQQYVPGLKVVSVTVPGNGSMVPDLRRSDHAPFWDEDLPAIMLTNTADFRSPHYHEPSDSIQYLNFTFMKQVVQATIAAVAEQANLRHSSSDTTSVQLTVTGIAEPKQAKWKLFPNPTKGTVTIELPLVQQELTLQVIDVNGRIEHEQAVKAGTQQVRLKSLQEGIYIIRLSGNGYESQQRLVVQQ